MTTTANRHDEEQMRNVASPLRPRWWPMATVAFMLFTGVSPTALAGERVTVVILPPLNLSSDRDDAPALELLCDQLAVELAKGNELQVVDRTQIDRVLAERAIGNITRPALAYDVLLRVSLDSSLGRPAVSLRIVDLSTGNEAGSHQWPWVREKPTEGLAEMARACRDLAVKAVSADKGRAKVRLLGVAAPGGMDRLEPMRGHLEADGGTSGCALLPSVRGTAPGSSGGQRGIAPAADGTRPPGRRPGVCSAC